MVTKMITLQLAPEEARNIKACGLENNEPNTNHQEIII